MVEAFVEEELAKVFEGSEEKRVESGVGGTRRVWRFVGDEAEAEFDDGRVVIGDDEVANDAVWGGETEVVGEEFRPGDVGVNGVKDLKQRVLFGVI